MNASPPWIVPVIEMPRLHLRAPTVEDAEALFGFLSDPLVMLHTDDEPYPDVERARLRIADWSKRSEHGVGLQWVITLGTSHDVIGTCGLHSLAPRHQRAELGFELDRKHWRKGYMTEAVTGVLSFAFKTLSMNKIEARSTRENVAAMAFLRSAGFLEEGVLREHTFWKGRFQDLRAFGMLAQDFQVDR
jgi:ribosomal-protein-alanine N-acetyltransferase